MTGNQTSVTKPEDTPDEANPVAATSASRRRILIVEDNETARKQIQVFLEADPSISVDTAANGSDALKALTERPYSVIVTDLKMPRVDGLQLLEEVQKRRLPADVIITTGFGTIDHAVQAMRMGAADFLTKPINLEHLRLVVAARLRERALQDEVAALREQLHEQDMFQSILSKSPRMHDVFELISHVAQTVSTVLIFGETGTGKELVARAVHEARRAATARSSRSTARPCPNRCWRASCSATRRGHSPARPASARGGSSWPSGGTIFLDEIGEIPLAMQAKLLRVLQERRFERVGGAQTVEVDVRVVAATNRDLLRLAKEGKFREDLYYRLNVVKIDLPPLRERPEDIPLLAAHFVQKFSRPGMPPEDHLPGGHGGHAPASMARKHPRAGERHRARLRHLPGRDDQAGKPPHRDPQAGPASLPAPRRSVATPDRSARRADRRLRGTLPPPGPQADPQPHRPHRPAHRPLTPHHHRQDRPLPDR